MTSKSKQKGNTYESELVKQAIAKGLESKRAWGSNGQSLGFAAEVDLLIGNQKIQAKRRKKLPNYLQIPDSCDAVICREDRGKSLVIIHYEQYLEMILCMQK